MILHQLAESREALERAAVVLLMIRITFGGGF